MATLKILGMRLEVTITLKPTLVLGTSSYISGNITKEIYCPNYRYYENGESTLSKSAYYSGMFNRTVFSLVDWKDDNLTLNVHPKVLVFDGAPELLDIRIKLYQIKTDGSMGTTDSEFTIGSSHFPLLSENEVDISLMGNSFVENGEYTSVGCFGFLGYEIFATSVSSEPIAVIGYFE